MKKKLLTILLIFAVVFLGVKNTYAGDSICGVSHSSLILRQSYYLDAGVFGDHCNSGNSGCKRFNRKKKCNRKKESCRNNCARAAKEYLESVGVEKTEDEKVEKVLELKNAEVEAQEAIDAADTAAKISIAEAKAKARIARVEASAARQVRIADAYALKAENKRIKRAGAALKAKFKLEQSYEYLKEHCLVKLSRAGKKWVCDGPLDTDLVE